MPPEPLEGGGVAVDGRADVYALGVMLHDARALRLAWRSRDDQAGHAFIERHRAAVLRSFVDDLGSTAEAEAPR